MRMYFFMQLLLMLMEFLLGFNKNIITGRFDTLEEIYTYSNLITNL